MKNIKIYNSRKRSNFIGLSLSMVAMTLGMVVLTWILFVLISKGFSAFNSNFFLIVHQRLVRLEEDWQMQSLEV